MFALSLVVIYTNSAKYGSNEFGAWEIVGTVIAGLGFFLEILADVQVFLFKKNPENKDKFCDAGKFYETSFVGRTTGVNDELVL